MINIKGKNVLVTGGAGFIGSHLVDELILKEVNKVVIVDNFFLGKLENINDAMENSNKVKLYRENAGDYFAMEAILKKEDIEVVFNLATKALIYSFFNPSGAYMENVNIANTLLNLQKEELFKTLIHVSSSEAYGSALYSPMDEKHPLNPTTPYAAGKLAADFLIMSFNNVLNLDVSIVRPFNNYGPRQNAGQLAAIIPLTAKRIMNGEKPIIEGDGEQTRDFIFVEDTARGLISAYENEKSRGNIINLGSGKEISIKKIISKICEYYNYTGEIDYRPERSSDVKRHCASINLAEEILRISPRISFEEGIIKTLDWYKNNL